MTNQVSAVATDLYETYINEGRRRLAEQQAADEAERQSDEVERLKKNRAEWQRLLAPAYAALPADLHPYVHYDESQDVTRYSGGHFSFRPANLDFVPCVSIRVRCDRNPCTFVAQRAECIRSEDDLIWIEYRDGTVFTDPLMAIAEAASFGANNARMEYQCHLMEKAAAGDEYAQHDLAQEFGIKPKAPAIASEHVAPPEPTDLENLLADAWRLLDDGDTSGCISSSAVVIAECLYALVKDRQPLAL